jgi:putative spermidine/putrescine transport system permease protein
LGSPISESPGWLRRISTANVWLLIPAMTLLVFGFVLPVLLFLGKAFDNSEIAQGLPRTIQTLAAWNGESALPDQAFDALALDLANISADQAGALARRLNTIEAGYRSLLLKTVNGLPDAPGSNAKEKLSGLDRRWNDDHIWRNLKVESGRVTPSYMLATIDLRLDEHGQITQAPANARIFVDLFIRTFVISITVTALCLALGFPAAWLMAVSNARWLSVLMVLVLLPFWTSTLVRSTAWIVLLQDKGLVNQFLLSLGLISKPLQLFATRLAVVIAMAHVLLPYMILPLYGAIKAIPKDLLRAADALGANPWRRFILIYLPLAAPGIGAGSLLVFILALGYYITPALVGGPGDQMVSYFIALYTNQFLNWGLASALSLTLLVCASLVYLLSRFIMFRSPVRQS